MDGLNRLFTLRKKPQRPVVLQMKSLNSLWSKQFSAVGAIEYPEYGGKHCARLYSVSCSYNSHGHCA